MKKKFGKDFINWLKKNKYSFGLSNHCPHCKTFKRKFTNPRSIPKYKGKTRIDYVPATLKGNRIVERDIDSLYRTFTKQKKRKRSAFGGINRKDPRITPWPSGSGALSRHDLTPLPGWGKFSMSPGGNRGGNAINCRQSGRWLSQNRSAPDFPLRRQRMRNQRFGNRNLVRGMPQSSTNKWYSKRGVGGFNARSKSIYAPDGNVFTRSYSPYTGARVGGRLPSPYGPIDTAALKGYPNGYSTPGGRLTTRKPRGGNNFGWNPFGKEFVCDVNVDDEYNQERNRELYAKLKNSKDINKRICMLKIIDNSIKYHDSAGNTTKRDNLISDFKILNERLQAYIYKKNSYKILKKVNTNDIKYLLSIIDRIPEVDCPWSNKAKCNYSAEFRAQDLEKSWNNILNERGESSFGNTVFGTEMDRAQFRPHAIRGWGSNYNSWDNQGLYLKGWNPWQQNTQRSASQRQFAKAAREVNRKWSNNVSFGSPTLSQMSGPNNVAYRKPFQMYNGGSMLGGNTINWTTRRNYLPPCKGPRIPRLKVQPNNNPTGYLANKNVTPISYARPRNPEILRYGRRKQRKKQRAKRSAFGMKPWTERSGGTKPWVAKGIAAERPYTTQMFSTNDSASSGFIRVGQPLELYSYQNNPNVGSYKYPEFSGPRNFYGGFGQRKRTQRKRKRAQKKKVKAGDTLVVKNGKVKVKTKSNKRTLRRR